MNITGISKQDTSLLLTLLSKGKKTVQQTSAVKPPAAQTNLEQKLVHVGYDNQGHDIVYNTSTNQKVSGADIKEQNSTSVSDEYTLNWWNKKYKGSLTADELAEKFAKGDNLSDEEYYYMLNNASSGKFDDARIKRYTLSEEQNLSEILAKNSIQLKSDDEINIRIDPQNKVTVSGINDPEKLQKVEDELNSKPNLLSSLYQVSSETYKKVSKLFYGAALSVAPAEQYLDQHTNGKISITDLKIQDGKIGGLTPELDSLLNKDVASYNKDIPAEKDAYEAKIQIINLLAYIKVNGAENLPHMDSLFTYKEGKLSYIEQPELVNQHPETMGIDEYYNKAMLLQNDPMQYYKWFTEAGNKGSNSSGNQLS